MIFHLYSFILYVLAVFYFPYMAVRLALKGRTRAGIGQRLGFFDKGFIKPHSGKTVWVHAVSVGETLAAVPVVKALKERHPDLMIYFSTVTETGNNVARENIGGIASIFFFPFDFRCVVGRVVSLLRPGLFVVVETEIWPNLLGTLHDKNIPAVMINGRISERSFRGYSKFIFLMSRVLQLISDLGMQTEQDAARIKALGAPGGSVRVLGNIKFDQASRSTSNGSKSFTKSSLGIPEDSLVFIAGSTHEGEEKEALIAYRKILEKYPAASMILAPRHPERLPRVEALLRDNGLGFRRKTMIKPGEPPRAGIILLDTMGELAAIYRVADFSFVGGSLVPVGGHNVLEPASFGKPVFFGPHMHNFAEISTVLRECGAGIIVRDGLELADEALRLISDPKRLAAVSEAAKAALARNRGALDRYVQLIEKYLYP
ncbi:MAG: 3-deoxy-D-manno-octulosonic acid transferase [Nitrospirota bacterium]